MEQGKIPGRAAAGTSEETAESLSEKGRAYVRTGLLYQKRKTKGQKQYLERDESTFREAGVEPEKVFPHNLRHLFARIFYRVTGNLTNLAGILGHSSLEATRVYTADGLEQWMRDIGRVQLLGKKITT